MLVPAILYKYEIQAKFEKHFYTDSMIYYNGCLESGVPNIEEGNDGYDYQYAIVDNDKLIGYFSYRIDWYSSSANCFGLFSFDKNNKVIGLDVYRELKKIISDYHIHRLEWRMIGGNPVEKHYDRFCEKYHGKKFVLTDAIKDRYGKYHNDIIYEIIFKNRNNLAYYRNNDSETCICCGETIPEGRQVCPKCEKGFKND